MMKKNAVVRICIWSVITLLLTATMVSLILVRPTLSWPGESWAFGVTGHTYRDAEHYTSGSTELSADSSVKNIEIHWLSGNVTVRPSEGNTLRIYEENTSTDPEKQLYWRLHNNTLYIQYCKSQWFLGFTQFGEKNLTVEIPYSMMEQLGELELEVASATARLEQVTVGKLEISTASGNVTLDKVSAREVEIDTASGEITAIDLAASDVSVDTASGKIELSGSIQRFDGDSASGNVTLRVATTLRELEFDSASGDLLLYLPADASFALEFDTLSGDFSCEFPTTKRGKTYLCGSGTNEYEIDTASGDVTVKPY